MKKLCQTADVLMPNLTEAAFLAGMDAQQEDWTEKELQDLIGRLREQGARSVVITSAVTGKKAGIYGFEEESGQYFTEPVDYIPVCFPGTGDLFSAVLTGEMLKGRTLRESTAIAARAVRTLIGLGLDSKDRYKGIPVEQYLGRLEV